MSCVWRFSIRARYSAFPSELAPGTERYCHLGGVRVTQYVGIERDCLCETSIGMANTSPDATPPHPVILRGWRGRWYETVMWNPEIFHVFAWFQQLCAGIERTFEPIHAPS
jgi:hypothetical protein